MAPVAAESTASGTLVGRRVLVVSHDFPPVRSPQAIRAWHFIHAVALEAAEVIVVCRTPPAGQELPTVPMNVRLVPASPGPFEALIDRLVSWRHRDRPTPGADAPLAGPTSLNWKGRLVKRARRALDLALYPDSRVCWSWHAGRALDALLDHARPDVALVMHEPAASLLLGRRLHEAGVPWLADLADPVMAPYTPRHWRRRAFALEAETLRKATRIAVTNEATAELLAERHGHFAVQPLILSQGHGMTRVAEKIPRRIDQASTSLPLRLCYTGRLYEFRRIDSVVDAIAAIDGVQLVFAGPEPPRALVEAAKRDQSRFLLCGELPHTQALSLQEGADVLLSIGNAGTVQSPGKLFEYFGAARPILHIASNSLDPQVGLIASLKRGFSCENDAASIVKRLIELRALHSEARLDEAFDLRIEAVERYGWPSIGARLCTGLGSLVERTNRHVND